MGVNETIAEHATGAADPLIMIKVVGVLFVIGFIVYIIMEFVNNS